MTIHKVLILTLAIFMAACASTIQSASISEAYKKYELKEFDRTLELIIRAENAKATSPEMKAELTYLKAQTHESLGQQQLANTLYEYLIEQHKGSQYGYLASKKLNVKL
jgi:lysyl-tRNA synthetase class I